MKIRTVSVSLGLTVPHPTRPYANYKPSVSVEAELGQGEDEAAVAAQLRKFCLAASVQFVADLVREGPVQ